METLLKIITEKEIQSRVNMAKAIELMRDAFRYISAGNAHVPVRTGITTKDESGRVLFMPSYLSSLDSFAIKVVSVFPENSGLGIPVIQGKLLLMDGKNGTPQAVLDAEYLTALRTGAASALATDLLARKNSEVLALIGAGHQAYYQAVGILEVRSIKRILLFSRSMERLDALKDRLAKEFDIAIEISQNKSVLREADIICTATTSDNPVINIEHLKSGVHINGIGSFKPSMNEIPADVIKSSLLVVDQRNAALMEAGDIVKAIQQKVITENHIHAELGEILTGKESGRSNDQQVTVFKSVGNAIQDLVVAHYVYSRM